MPEKRNCEPRIRTKDEFHKNGPTLAISSLSRDSRRRTLAKTVVYRTVAIALLAGIAYFYTGNAGEATTITVLFNVTGAIAYYGLERLWEAVHWGRNGMERMVSHRAGGSLNPSHANSLVVSPQRPDETG